MAVITISRQVAALGDEISSVLAKKLNYKPNPSNHSPKGRRLFLSLSNLSEIEIKMRRDKRKNNGEIFGLNTGAKPQNKGHNKPHILLKILNPVSSNSLKTVYNGILGHNPGR